MSNDNAYKHTYYYMIRNYNCEKYFTNYDEFKIFCETDFSNKSDLIKLVMCERNELIKIITEKLIQYNLTHNNTTGKLNEKITYFKYTYRR